MPTTRYVGRLVRNRRNWRKKPETGKRIAYANDQDAVVVDDVPHLRIVSDDLAGSQGEAVHAGAAGQQAV
jgi:hypothetical protein